MVLAQFAFLYTIPIESITKALREKFLKARAAQLVAKVTHSVIETAFKKVINEEENEPGQS